MSPRVARLREPLHRAIPRDLDRRIFGQAGYGTRQSLTGALRRLQAPLRRLVWLPAQEDPLSRSPGPLEQSRPRDTHAVVGVHRLLQRIWRLAVDEQTGAVRVCAAPAADEVRRQLHRTIAAVRDGLEALRFNTSIAGSPS
jgi:hypothetical protein